MDRSIDNNGNTGRDITYRRGSQRGGRGLKIAFTCLLTAVMLMSGLAGVFADSTINAQDSFTDTVTTRGNFQYNVGGVHQSTSTTSVSTFGSAMPLSTIYIDMNYLTPEQGVYAKLASTSNTHQASFADGIKTMQVSTGKTYVVYDPAGLQLQLKAGQDNYLAGNLFSYTFPNAAVLTDGSRASVKITYSNAHIYVDQRLGSAGADSPLNGAVHLAYGNSVQYGNEDTTYYDTYNGAVKGSTDHPVSGYSNTKYAVTGLSMDARIQVVDDNGDPIDGTFIFPTVGLNIDRDPDSGFGYAKPLWYFEDSYPEYDFFSEALRINSGNKADIYVRPNSSIEESAPDSGNKNYYQPMITEVLSGAYQGAVKFTADTKPQIQTQANNNAYVSGFITTADAASGISVTTTGHGTYNGVMNTSLMTGTQIWHRIRSVTGPGGNIQTTTEANYGGDLSDGGKILGQGTYVVPDGKTVVYTMKPDKGYVLDTLRINNSITDVPTEISGVAEMAAGETKTVSLADGKTGTITKKDDGSYTFEFPYNNYDHSIMVTWVPVSVKVSAVKKWYDKNNKFGTRENIVVHVNGAANYESGESHHYPEDYLPSQSYAPGRADDGNDDWTATWGDGKANNHFTETVYPDTDSLPATNTDGKALYYFYDYSKRQFRAYTYNSTTGEFEATGDSYWVNFLPKYDESGKEITYTVDEDVPAGYSLTVTSNGDLDADFGYNLINSLEPVATARISVQKALDGRAFGSNEDYVFILAGEDGTPMPVKTSVKIPGRGDDEPDKVVASTTTAGKINEARKTAAFGVISYRKSDLKEKAVTYASASDKERSRVRFWTLTYADPATQKKVTRTFDMNDAADRTAFESLPGAGVFVDGAKGSVYSAVFKYTVSENPEHGPMVENDSAMQVLTVDVVYDELAGKFYIGGVDATASQSSDLDIAKVDLKPVYFENDYDNKTDFEPEIIKDLNGRPISADQYKNSFTIKAVDTEEGYGVDTKLRANNTPMPGGTYGGTAVSSTQKIKTTNAGEGGTNDVQAVIGFDKAITYKNDDLKKEIKKSEQGKEQVIEWTYGNTVYGPIPDDAVNSEAIVVDGTTYDAGTVKYAEATESQRQAAKGDTAESLWTFEGKKRVDDRSLAPNDAVGSYYMSERIFTYKVWESSSAAPGYTNDSHNSEATAFQMKVKVTRDDNTGKITVSKIPQDGPVFTNKYEASGDVTIKAQKKIKGRDLAAGDFEFEIEAVTAGAPLPAPNKVSNQADGTIEFGAVTFTQNDLKRTAAEPGAYDAVRTETGYYEKTFIYRIKETSTDGSGVTTDKNSRTVAVTVREDGAGNIKVVAVNGNHDGAGDSYLGTGFSTQGASSSIVKAGIFTNEYNASGNVTIEAEKVLNGGLLRANDFYFTLEDCKGNVIGTYANDADGKISFSIAYNLDKVNQDKEKGICTSADTTDPDNGPWTYTYTIKELQVDGRGTDDVTIDSHAETVTVKVTDNGRGDLNAAVTYDQDGAKFENTVRSRDLILQKIWIDNDADGISKVKRPDSVTLTLTADTTDANVLTPEDGWSVSGNTSIKKVALTEALDATSNDALWRKVMEVPAYNSDGTKINYTVDEADDDVPANYIKSVIPAANTVINTYDITSISGTKKWVDGGLTHCDSAELKGKLTVSWTDARGGSGTVDKPHIDWDDATHTYTVIGLSKFSENGALRTYSVTETPPEGYTVSYENTGESGGTDKALDGGTIVNTIEGKIDVTGTKVWKDREEDDAAGPKPDLNLFRKSKKEGSDVESVTATPIWDNDKTSYTFKDQARYDDKGYEYVYWVTENQIDGYLPPVYSDGDKALNGGTITNIKEPNGTLDINATKIMTGSTRLSDWDFVLSLYTGQSASGDKVGDSIRIREGVLSEDGLTETKDVVFEDIAFRIITDDNGRARAQMKVIDHLLTPDKWINLDQNPDGTYYKDLYVYETPITENNKGLVQPADGGTKVTVVVVNNLDGTLSARIASGVSAGDVINDNYDGTVLADAEYDSAKVLNRHEQTVNADIKVKKILRGRNLKADDAFVFKAEYVPDESLSKAEKARLAAGFSSSAESITIANMTRHGKSGNTDSYAEGSISYQFSKTGTYSFKVTESGEVAGVTNDTKDGENVTVVVTKDTDGKLKAVITYADGSEADFTNTYDAKGDATVMVRKLLNGISWDEDMNFWFRLEPHEAPEGYTTATMPKPGKARRAARLTDDEDTNHRAIWTFGEFRLSDAGKEFVYKVTEEEPKFSGYVADEWDLDISKLVAGYHTIKVVPKDKGDGTLDFDLYYDSDTAPESQALVVTNRKHGSSRNFFASKSLVDSSDAPIWPEDMSFDLILTGKDGAPLPSQEDIPPGAVLTGSTETVTVTNAREVNFGAVKFDSVYNSIKAGKHKDLRYEITEDTSAADPHIDYGIKETARYIIIVTIAKDSSGIAIDPHVIYYKGSVAEENKIFDSNDPTSGHYPVIKNRYTAEGELSLELTKVLDGGNLSAGQFGFTLYDSNKQVVKDKDGNDIKGKTNDGEGNVTLGTLKFTETDAAHGSVTYNIREDIPAGAVAKDDETLVYGTETPIEVRDAHVWVMNGITYDPEISHPVTVALRDDGKGNIIATASTATSTNKLTVRNIYDAEGVYVQKVYKYLFERPITRVGFDFEMKPVGVSKSQTEVELDDDYSKDDVPMPDGTAAGGTAKATVSPSVSPYSTSGTTEFRPITYTMDDLVKSDGLYAERRSFVYEIYEKPGTNTSIQYSETHYNAIVTVTNNDGKLKVSGPVYKIISGEEPSKKHEDTSYANFNNVYDANGKAGMDIIKEVEGRSWQDIDRFKFFIEPYESDTIHSYKGGDQNKKINKSDVPLPGNTIDPNNRGASGNSSTGDNANMNANGQYEAYAGNSDPVSGIGGRYAAIKDTRFTDEMLDYDAADGFLKGTFFYKITEDEENLADGFTPKTQGLVYYARIDVSDNRLGTLSTTVTYYDTENDAKNASNPRASAPLFTNIYDAKGIAEIKLRKFVDKGSSEDDRGWDYLIDSDGFTFELKPIAGGPGVSTGDVVIKKTTENHAGTFQSNTIGLELLNNTTAAEDDLYYSDGVTPVPKDVRYGEFPAKLVEKDHSVTGVDKDKTEIYVKLTAIDKLDGTIDTRCTFYSDEAFTEPLEFPRAGDGYDVTFTNIYRNVMDLRVEKTWHDTNDEETIAGRPAITIQLTRRIEGGNTEILDKLDGNAKLYGHAQGGEDPVEITYADGQATVAADKLPVTFKDLPATDKNGNDYIYEIVETDAGSGYFESAEPKVIREGSDTEPRVIMLTDTATTKVHVSKKWKDNNDDTKRGNVVVVALYRNGTLLPNNLRLMRKDDDPAWEAEFAYLPMYDEDNTPYEYTAREMAVPDDYYTSLIEYSLDNSSWSTSLPEGWNTDKEKYVRITNILLTELTVKKVWDGIPTSNVTFDLYRTTDADIRSNPESGITDGKWTPDDKWEKVEGVSHTFTTEEFYDDDGKLIDPAESSYTFKKLEKYDRNGTEYVYRVLETSTGQYFTANQDSNVQVTNTNEYDGVGAARPNVVKELEGRRWNSTDKFYFRIEAIKGIDDDGKPIDFGPDEEDEKRKVPLPDDGDPSTGRDDITSVDASKERVGAIGRSVDFANIIFVSGRASGASVPQDGTAEYFYKVYEVDESGDPVGGKTENGITYTDDVHTLRILAADDGNGNVTTQRFWDGKDSSSAVPVFVNEYKAYGEIHGYVIKRIAGREFKEGDRFAFEYTNLSGSPVRMKDPDDPGKTDPVVGVIGPVGYGESDGVYVDGTAGNYAATGADSGSDMARAVDVNYINSGDLVAGSDGILCGTFVYQFKELEKCDDPAVSKVSDLEYDDNYIYLRVNVTDNEDGTLRIDQEYFLDAACTQPLEGREQHEPKLLVNAKTGEIAPADASEGGDYAYVATGYFRNRLAIDITVTKKWVDNVGNKTDPMDTVTVNLRRYPVYIDADGKYYSDQAHTIPVVLPTNINAWDPVGTHVFNISDFYNEDGTLKESSSYVFTGLEKYEHNDAKGVPTGREYVYRVREASGSSAYETTYRVGESQTEIKDWTGTDTRGDAVTVVNKTVATNVSNIAAVKQLLGREWLSADSNGNPADRYKFELTAVGMGTYDSGGELVTKDGKVVMDSKVGTNIPMPASVISSELDPQTETNRAMAANWTEYADGSVHAKEIVGEGERLARFGSITYTIDDLIYDDNDGHMQGDFFYTVKEVVPEGATQNDDGTYTYKGVTYDNKVHTVHVKVRENRTKDLVVQVAYDEKTEGKITTGTQFTPVFTNRYSTEAVVAADGEKYIMGRKWTKDDKFDFTMAPIGGAPFNDADKSEFPAQDTQTEDDRERALNDGKAVHTSEGAHKIRVPVPNGKIGTNNAFEFTYPKLIFTEEDLNKVTKNAGELKYSNGRDVPANTSYAQYMYVFEEIKSFADDLPIDKDPEYMKVTIIDKGDGTLDVSIGMFTDRYGLKPRYNPETGKQSQSAQFVDQATRDITAVKIWRGDLEEDVVVRLQYRKMDSGEDAWIDYDTHTFTSADYKRAGNPSHGNINGLAVTVSVYEHEFSNIPVFADNGDNNHLADKQLVWRVIEDAAVNPNVITYYGVDDTVRYADRKEAEGYREDWDEAVDKDVSYGSQYTTEDLEKKLYVTNVYAPETGAGTASVSLVKELAGRDWTESDGFVFKLDPVGIGTYDDKGSLIEGSDGLADRDKLKKDEGGRIITDIPLPASDGIVTIDNDKLSESQRQAVFGDITYSIGDLTLVEKSDGQGTVTGEVYEGDFYYDMREVIPDDARMLDDEGKETDVRYADATPEQKESHRFKYDDVIYDGSKHEVHVHAERSGDSIVTTVRYDGKAVGSAIPVFVNTVKDAGSTTIVVSKKWDDANDQDGMRPGSVTVNVSADGETVDSLTLSDDNNWKSAFRDLPVYKADGSRYDYTISEENVPEGYKAAVEYQSSDKTWYDSKPKDWNNRVRITNRHEPVEQSISATKVWVESDGVDTSLSRSDVVLHLYGKENGLIVYDAGTKTISKDAETESDRTVTWNDIPKRHHSDTDLTWEVTEEPVYGYITEISGDFENGFTVTNTYAEPVTDVTATKIWDDEDVWENEDYKHRPDEVTFELWRKVGDTVEDEPYDSVGVDSSSGWEHTWNNLPVVEKDKSGKATVPILYMVKEAEIEDSHYAEPVYRVEEPGKFEIVNAFKKETIDIPVTKVWNDNENSSGLRPDHITLYLRDVKHDKVVRHFELSKDEAAEGDAQKWKHTFMGLPKYDENGEEITYKVSEKSIAGYDVSVTGDNKGFTVTNTHSVGAKTSLTVTKKWEGDKSDKSGRTSVEVSLIQIIDGIDGARRTIDTQTIKYDKSDPDAAMKYTWDNLDTVYHKGGNSYDVIYTVEEKPVKGYTAHVGETKVRFDKVSVGESDNPKELGLYEKKGDSYEPTADASPQQGKDYYERHYAVTVTNEKGEIPLRGDVIYVDPKNPVGKNAMIIKSASYKSTEEARKAAENRTGAPSDPKHKGVRFVGWDLNWDDNGNYVLVAVYSEISPEVTPVTTYIDPLSGKPVLISELTNDPSSVKVPKDPRHKNMQFVGWVKSVDAGGNTIFVAKFDPDCANRANTNGDGKKVRTGDEENAAFLWVVVMILSMILLSVYVTQRTRENRSRR